MKLLISISNLSIVIVLTMVMFSSCNSPDKQDIPTGETHLKLDPFDLPPISKLSVLVESVKIIPLETSSSCIIGSTNKVFVGDDYILVSSRSGRTDELILFSKEGKFLNKIGAVGKGPGEYSDIRQFSVFEDSLVVYVSPMRSRKVTKYGFDGSFLQEITNPEGMVEPMVLNFNRIAYSGRLDYEVQIFSTLEPDTQQYIKIEPGTRSRMPFFSGNPHTGFFYTAMGRDTIWRIDKDSMRPAVVCNFGNGHLSSADFMKSIRSGGFPPKKLSIGPGAFYSTNYYHFYLYREDEDGENTICHVLLNDKTGESWHLTQNEESDDILFCSSTDFRTASPNGEWVSVVGAHELIEALQKIKDNKEFNYPDNLIEQIENLTIEDNPVLVLYTLF